MGFFKRKKTQFKQGVAANRIIKDKARAAKFQAREVNKIRLAKERERIKTDSKLKKLKSPSGGFIDSITKLTTPPPQRRVRRTPQRRTTKPKKRTQTKRRTRNSMQQKPQSDFKQVSFNQDNNDFGDFFLK